jgi:hypothetical protein
MQTALATIQNLSLKDTLQFLEESFMQDGSMIGTHRKSHEWIVACVRVAAVV